MASLPDKKKKRKHNKPKDDPSVGTLTLSRLKTLSHELLSSRSHLNNLPILLSALTPTSPLDLALEALISLQSFFLPLLPEIPSSSSSSSSSAAAADNKDPQSVYRAWLRARFDEFVNSLIELAISPQSDGALKDVALDAIMDFVKLGKDGRFQSAIYHKLLHSIVHAAGPVGPLLDLLVPKYFKYIDVRYFTYTSMDKITKDFESSNLTVTRRANLCNDGELPESSKEEVAVRVIYNFLSHIPPVELLNKDPSYEMWSQLGTGETSSKTSAGDAKDQKSKAANSEVSPITRIVKKIKLKFTKAWLSFLKLPLPLDVYKEVLASLHQVVIPYMANPAILCDFLTKSYDIGGVISVMALSGLFILMTQHGLEYPNFYEKLYVLLTPPVFIAKHRAVFFQLLDTCLKSSHLPAYLAAAFVKKLSRLALSVPPSGELLIIAVIHNLLRRHPSINFLVHQHADDEAGTDAMGSTESSEDVRDSDSGPLLHSKNNGVDPFNIKERDPAKSDAMRSSLWEIDTLRHHYCPAVSRFVASLENDLTVRAKTSEITVADFSSGSYATIFREEIRRRIKQVPLAFYKTTPDSLFSESDFPGWTFVEPKNGEQNEGNGVTVTVENDDWEPMKRQRIESS